MMKYKKCIDCKEVKPATTQFYYRDRLKKDGLNMRCKKCFNIYQKKKRLERKEKLINKYSLRRRDL